jgi:uncharacterized protein YifN (PemK superfamily)
MIKKRLVVVLNAKHQNACVVVPLSTTQDKTSETRGFHIPIPTGTLPAINYWDDCERWAKCDTIQMVSNTRLGRVVEARGHAPVHLPATLVTEIQKGVIKVIGGGSTFLAPAQTAADLATATIATAAGNVDTPSEIR